MVYKYTKRKVPLMQNLYHTCTILSTLLLTVLVQHSILIATNVCDDNLSVVTTNN